MHLTAPTVSRVQRESGLPTRLVWPEAKILKLFKRGWGGYRISRHLHVPANQVFAVAHKNHFRRKDDVGYPTNPQNEERFIAAVKNREDYIIRLARKYKVGICKAQRLAREVLATPRFRPGASKPPLSSNFPQRHFDTKLAQPRDYIQLVSKVLVKCFRGEFPPLDDAALVGAMMHAFSHTCLEGQPQVVLDSFAQGLGQAVRTLRASEQATWKN